MKSHWNIPTLDRNKNKNKNKNKKQHSDACLHPCHSSSQTRQWSIRRKEFIKFHGNFSGKSFLSKQMYFLVSSLRTILTGQRSQHNWIHFQEKNLIIFFLCRWVLWEMGILGYKENSCLKKMSQKMDLIKIIFKVCQSDERI